MATAALIVHSHSKPAEGKRRLQREPPSVSFWLSWTWLGRKLKDIMAGMKIQLVCMILLAFSSWGLCSDSEEEMKALEADLLTNMHTSKISKASVPSWKMTLLNVCSLINNLNSQPEEAGEIHEEELVTRRKLPIVLDGFSLEAMLTIYQLQKICHSRAFQHWEMIQEDILENGNDKNEKEEIIKRKIPYILKRQLYENKSRRPYILKRSSYYY